MNWPAAVLTVSAPASRSTSAQAARGRLESQAIIARAAVPDGQRPAEMIDRPQAPLAQLDRASGFEPEGRRFDSCRAHLAAVGRGWKGRRMREGASRERDERPWQRERGAWDAPHQLRDAPRTWSGPAMKWLGAPTSPAGHHTSVPGRGDGPLGRDSVVLGWGDMRCWEGLPTTREHRPRGGHTRGKVLGEAPRCLGQATSVLGRLSHGGGRLSQVVG